MTKLKTFHRENQQKSGKKKEPKPKLFGPDIFGWGGGLPREWVGAEKFGMSLETRETKLFWRDIPGFCRDIPEGGVPEKFEQKNVCVQFSFPTKLATNNPPHFHSPKFKAHHQELLGPQSGVRGDLPGVAPGVAP